MSAIRDGRQDVQKLRKLRDCNWKLAIFLLVKEMVVILMMERQQMEFYLQYYLLFLLFLVLRSNRILGIY